MTFMAVEDSFYDHAKTIALFDGPCPGPAVALWTLAGSWSSRHLQNGFVPTGRVKLFGLDKRAAKELVRVGLWLEVEGGYRFHEWLERNPSREAVETKRAKTAERVARFRQKRLGNAPATLEQRAGNDPCNAVTEGVTNAHGDALVRVPPDPRPQTPASSNDEAAAARAPNPGPLAAREALLARLLARLHAGWGRRFAERTATPSPPAHHTALRPVATWCAEWLSTRPDEDPDALVDRLLAGCFGGRADLARPKPEYLAEDPGRYVTGTDARAKPAPKRRTDRLPPGTGAGFSDDDIPADLPPREVRYG